MRGGALRVLLVTGEGECGCEHREVVQTRELPDLFHVSREVLGAVIHLEAVVDLGRPPSRHRIEEPVGILRRQSGRQGARPLLLIAVAIGVADLLFAFDSIPAVFGITTNALLVVACNVFALMDSVSCTRCWPGCWAGSST